MWAATSRGLECLDAYGPESRDHQNELIEGEELSVGRSGSQSKTRRSARDWLTSVERVLGNQHGEKTITRGLSNHHSRIPFLSDKMTARIGVHNSLRFTPPPVVGPAKKISNCANPGIADA